MPTILKVYRKGTAGNRGGIENVSVDEDVSDVETWVNQAVAQELAFLALTLTNTGKKQSFEPSAIRGFEEA